MKNKITLTIGIPAFNEGRNIKSLLTSLLKQDFRGITLQKILVVSDGSTDKTVSLVKSLHDRRIKVLKSFKRHGLAHTQNIIIDETKSQILVLLNADILIKDTLFIKKLIYPIAHGKADITSAKITPVAPTNFVEKMLATSKQLEQNVYNSIKNGQNIYMCNGSARAFSKKFYKKIRFPYSIGEDSYSYLLALKTKMKYRYVKEAEVFYKLPGTFSDHEKQSIRFKKSVENNKKMFGDTLNSNAYALPVSTFFKSIAIITFFNPVYMAAYVTLYLFILVKNIKREVADIWVVVESTKNW